MHLATMQEAGMHCAMQCGSYALCSATCSYAQCTWLQCFMHLAAVQEAVMHYAMQEAVMHYAVRFSGMQSLRGNGFVPVRRGGHLTQSVSLVQLIDHHLSQLDAHHQEADP